jgi:hypothetical protein
VDDEGIGYRDEGGEMWEYEEVNDKKTNNRKRKLNQKGNQDIEQFMQPASALANKRKQLNATLKQQQKVPKVSAEQSKDIMNDLMAELDGEDEEDLQEVHV